MRLSVEAADREDWWVGTHPTAPALLVCTGGWVHAQAGWGVMCGTLLPFNLVFGRIREYYSFWISRGNAMELDEETAWSMNVIDASHVFAETVRRLCDENPSKLADPLTRIMNDTMTELWDRGFSQTEIRQAFLGAVSDMDRYAGGDERRN